MNTSYQRHYISCWDFELHLQNVSDINLFIAKLHFHIPIHFNLYMLQLYRFGYFKSFPMRMLKFHVVSCIFLKRSILAEYVERNHPHRLIIKVFILYCKVFILHNFSFVLF